MHGGGHQFLRALLEKRTATLRKLPPVRPDAGWALPRKIYRSFKKCNLPLLLLIMMPWGTPADMVYSDEVWPPTKH